MAGIASAGVRAASADTHEVIRIDAAWIAVEPLDMRAGVDTALARVVKVFGGDSKGFAAHFAPDGSFTNVIGMVSYGKEAFEKRHADILTTIFKGSVLKQSIDKLRFVRPDVAILNINTGMTGFVEVPPGVTTGKDNVIRTK